MKYTKFKRRYDRLAALCSVQRGEAQSTETHLKEFVKSRVLELHDYLESNDYISTFHAIYEEYLISSELNFNYFMNMNRTQEGLFDISFNTNFTAFYLFDFEHPHFIRGDWLDMPKTRCFPIKILDFMTLTNTLKGERLAKNKKSKINDIISSLKNDHGFFRKIDEIHMEHVNDVGKENER